MTRSSKVLISKVIKVDNNEIVSSDVNISNKNLSKSKNIKKNS